MKLGRISILRKYDFYVRVIFKELHHLPQTNPQNNHTDHDIPFANLKFAIHVTTFNT